MVARYVLPAKATHLGALDKSVLILEMEQQPQLKTWI
jgi:hypothetical protein